MNLLNILYCVGCSAVGVILGIVVEYMIDVKIVKDCQDENRTLRLKLEEARKTQKVEHVHVYEINDNRGIEIPDYSQRW